jgi:hypothetical protein
MTRFTARGRARARFIRPGTDNLRAPRRLGDAELLVLDLLQHELHRALENDGGVAVRDLAAKKRLETAELVVGLLVDGELDPVALGGRGLDDRARRITSICWRVRRLALARTAA